MNSPPQSRRGCRGQRPRRGWLVCRVRRRQITATAARSTRVVVPTFKTPLKSPLVQGGTLFSSNVAPQRGMKIPSLGGVARSAGVGSFPTLQLTPGPDGPCPSQEGIQAPFLSHITPRTPALWALHLNSAKPRLTCAAIALSLQRFVQRLTQINCHSSLTQSIYIL